ncbi:MAG: cellulose binding domain-containing protein [Myxococcota bacterium]|nr:cellulose binding domain-containing protein [Myxococcota bacterium]
MSTSLSVATFRKLLKRSGLFLLPLALMSSLTACDFGSPTCKVEYTLLDDWGSGFNASIKLTSELDESLTEWELVFHRQHGQQIVNVENAELIADPNVNRLRSLDDTLLEPGSTSEILISVSQPGSRNTPKRFRLNEKICEGGSVERLSFLDQLGRIVEILAPMNPATAEKSPEDRFAFELGTESVDLGFTELHRGIARFFARGSDWADLQVEAPGTSRHVRMHRTADENEYMIFGLSPGDLIRYRFLVGLHGQTWTNWHEATYSGLDGAIPSYRVPRLLEIEAGRLAFEIDGHPWAEIHTQIGQTFLARRLDTTETGHQLIIDGLQPGDRIDYRWVIGIEQNPGQYDTDWSTYIYGGRAETPSPVPTPQPDPQTPSIPDPSEEDETDPPPSTEEDPPPDESIENPPNPDPPPAEPPGPGDGMDETTLLRFESDTLYLFPSEAPPGPGTLEFESGLAGTFDRVPAGSASVVYQANQLDGLYDPSEGNTAFQIWMDGWLTGIAYLQARVLYDFEGDGVTDREELYVAAPAHAQRGLNLYDSEFAPLIEVNGEYRNLESGTVRLELSNPHATGGPDIFTQADARERARSFLEIPFDFSVIEDARKQPEKTEIDFPEGVLCPLSPMNSRCGLSFNPEEPFFNATEIGRIKQNGLEAFRKPGVHGACAGCHVPDAFDLAVIGYSDEDIRRRALEHVSPTEAEEIVQLVQAQRQAHDLRRILHPAHFRPLQPGFEPLPGKTPQDRDLAFLQFLHDEVGLLLVTDHIDSREKALEAQRQLLALDLHSLRIGVRLDRWSEDEFHGLSHQGQDPLDGSGAIGQNGSVAEWLPNMASRPDDPARFYQIFDQYADNPIDQNFWAFYDSLSEATHSEEFLSSNDDDRAFEWMAAKYQSIQVMGHMLRQKTLKYPDRVIDLENRDPIVEREVAMARQPIWHVGDLIRQYPLHCDHPDGCTVFPDFVKNETDQEKLQLQSRVLERAWFWAGWMLDPSLLTLDESFPTVSGDYFYPLHQGHWGGHYAFILAKMSVEKANVDGWSRAIGAGVAGHGKWASTRPFLVYKHSEFQRPMFGEYDPRHELQKRLLTNTARMWLYLVHEDVERTGTAFDRSGTAKAINFARLNWLEGTDPGGPREDVERIFAETVEMLRDATELRQQHHTDDLYEYLPVAEVPLD